MCGYYPDLQMQANMMCDRYNERLLAWTAATSWTFSRNFSCTADLLHAEHADLVLDGLDTVVSIYINDRHAASTRSAFRQVHSGLAQSVIHGAILCGKTMVMPVCMCSAHPNILSHVCREHRVPIKHLLHPGDNLVSIRFQSAGAFAEQQAAAYPYDVVGAQHPSRYRWL